MKNYKFLVPILLVALLGGSVYKTYSDREKINKQYDNDITQARQNRKLEVYVNAEEDYLDALKLKDSAKLRAELGEMYIEAEDLRTAAKWGESLISEYPKEQVGYEFLIQVYLEQKDYASCFRIKDEADGLKISSKKIEEIISDIKYEYYLEGEYAQVEEFSNGYAAVKKEKKWGYLNSKGHRVIESEFEEAGAFAKEVAPVIDDKGRAFYIDNEGNRKIVIDFVDNIEKLGYMSMDNIFPVNDGKKWSLYSLDSKKKIAGDYDEVSAMSFTYENQGNNTYLVYKIGASDNVDTMSLGMITNNKIDGIVPTLFTQSDTDRFIKYNISAKVSAKEFLSGVVNKKRLLGVFISVLKAIKSTEEYMIDARRLLIDLEHIYVDVSKCDAMLVCLPLVRQNESVNIPMFFKQIMFSTQFDQNENCDYVAQIINYLNSTPVFSVDAFEKLLMDIDADNLNIAASKAVVGQQKPVQPQSQSQSQQPKPMQPAMNQLKNEQVQTNMPSQGKMQSQRETQSANNVVQPNQVNFAVPNMNPQNQNRINNNVQMGTNISGTYVETTSEKQMSMFGLLTHYSKENKQIYERQKAQRKAQKEAEKNGAAMPGQNVKPSNVSFAIPGQPPQQRPQPAQAQPQPVMPQQPQQQFAQPQRQFTQSNQPQRQFAQPQPMPQAQQKPAQQVQPQSVQNQNTNTGMTGNPSVPPQILENMTKAGNFGETTVLGVGSEAGETTVLGTSQAQIIKPYLLRIKNNERIELNKPVFRIGKERSYVDYFVSDNTAVSRSHANIINKDNEFYIVDTNSTNHTYVNGSMIQSNVETKIEHGTKIRLANEDFEFFMY